MLGQNNIMMRAERMKENAGKEIGESSNTQYHTGRKF